MDILFVLIPLSLILVAGGCWAFFWAVDSGQFDNLDSAAWDALEEEQVNCGSNEEVNRESRIADRDRTLNAPPMPEAQNAHSESFSRFCTIPDPRSAIHAPQSTIRDPRSAIHIS